MLTHCFACGKPLRGKTKITPSDVTRRLRDSTYERIKCPHCGTDNLDGTFETFCDLTDEAVCGEKYVFHYGKKQ